MRYPVVIHQEGNSAYGVTVPDIPGCFSAGDTIDEAMENAREAIFAHLELVIEGGGDIADAHPIEAHKRNKDYAGGIWAYVDANIDDLLGPAERINVTIPKRALQKIDMAAKQSGDSRSALLTRAALELISGSHAVMPVGSGKLIRKSLASEAVGSYRPNPIKARVKRSAAAKRKAG